MTGYEYQVAEAKALLKFFSERSKRIEDAITAARKTTEGGFEAPAESYLREERREVMRELKHVGERGYLL